MEKCELIDSEIEPQWRRERGFERGSRFVQRIKRERGMVSRRRARLNEKWKRYFSGLKEADDLPNDISEPCSGKSANQQAVKGPSSKEMSISERGKCTLSKPVPWTLWDDLDESTKVYSLPRANYQGPPCSVSSTDETMRECSVSTTDEQEWSALISPSKRAKTEPKRRVRFQGVPAVKIVWEDMTAEQLAREIFNAGRVFLPEDIRIDQLVTGDVSDDKSSQDLMDYLPKWPKCSDSRLLEGSLRDPSKYFYLPVPCFRGIRCSDTFCSFSHSQAEVRAHPINMDRKKCRGGFKCHRSTCTFSHSENERVVSENRWLTWEATWNGWRHNLEVIKQYIFKTVATRRSRDSLWEGVLKASKLRFGENVSAEVGTWMDYLEIGVGAVCPFFRKLALQPENLVYAAIPRVSDVVQEWASVLYGDEYTQEICKLRDTRCSMWQKKTSHLKSIRRCVLADFKLKDRKQTEEPVMGSIAKEFYDNLSVSRKRYFLWKVPEPFEIRNTLDLNID